MINSRIVAGFAGEHRGPVEGSAVHHGAIAAVTLADVLDQLTSGRFLTFDGTNPDGTGAAQRIGFAELGALTAWLAPRWSGLGVAAGDRVLLVVADEYEFIPLFLSALHAGIVAVPVYPPFRPGRLDDYSAELRRIRAVARPVCCVVSGPLRGLIAEAGLGLPIHDYAALRVAPAGRSHRPAARDLAFLQFSSGSTGMPKAAMVSHGALLANMLAIRAGLATDGERDRAVNWLPLYHDMGLVGFVLVPLLDEVPTWYLRPLRFARDPVSWLRLLSEVRGTIAFAPNFAYGLAARRVTDDQVAELDLAAWRVAGCGAEPVHADTLRAFANRLAPSGFRPEAFLPSYGLAESTLAVALAPRDTGVRTLTVDADRLAADRRVSGPAPATRRITELVSCGFPVAGSEIRVVDERGLDCADGVEGEVVVRGPSLADGYFGAPELTERVWRDGWLHTGDHGLRHAGELYVTGRGKDLIVINGVNYQPQDIERAASEVPGVRLGHVAALAVRAGDTEGVELVVAVRAPVDSAGLAARVRRVVFRRIGITVGEVTVFEGELPKTSSGKLRRSLTAELLAAGVLAGQRG
ncbi:AMP-binding protein [Amycolatopsis pigmentata]|uniref:AMP-binding protein n=1 Tax=Amycolatopsis pigmentata TaxID=450801 RepID=A0ABW5FKF0_9PSEU